VAHDAADASLGGVHLDDATAAKLPTNIGPALTGIAHQASTDASRKAMLYTGVFLLGAFAVSFALPNTRDLEGKAAGRH
jgi:hypothetical protein